MGRAASRDAGDPSLIAGIPAAHPGPRSLQIRSGLTPSILVRHWPSAAQITDGSSDANRSHPQSVTFLPVYQALLSAASPVSPYKHANNGCSRHFQCA